MKKLQSTDPRVKEAIVLYKSGIAVRPICKQLKMDGEALRNVLISEGILRTRAQAVRLGKTDSVIFEDALDILTPEALYWVGFMYADGHLSKRRPRIDLTLTVDDILHLDKYASFFGNGLNKSQVQNGMTLGSNGYIAKKAYRVSFSCEKLYARYCELGFSHRKTWSIIPHDALKYSRDFWRGVVDGDGWIGRGKQDSLGLCGHHDTIIAFLNFIKKCGISTEVRARKSNKSEHLWSCELHSSKMKSVLILLYKNSAVYLDRKYQKYLEIIN